MKENKKLVKFPKKTIPMLLVGAVFFFVGMALLIILLKEIIEKEKFAWPILIFLMPCLAAGIFLFVWGGKNIAKYIKGKIVINKGIESYCRIANVTCVSIGASSFRGEFFSLTVSYEDNGKQKIFKTVELFDENEYKYLKSLDKIKMVHYKDFVVITELFSADVYQTYRGIKKKFFSEKPYSTMLRIFSVITIVGIIVAITGLIIGFIYDNFTTFFVGLGITVAPIFVAGIIYSIILFSKGNRDKR